MCDYSLHGLENRLAEEGEVLVVHQFYSGSKGLTSPEYLKPTEQPKGLMAILKRKLAARSKVCRAGALATTRWTFNMVGRKAKAPKRNGQNERPSTPSETAF